MAARQRFKLPNGELRVWRSDLLDWLRTRTEDVHESTDVRFWGVRRNNDQHRRFVRGAVVVAGRARSRARRTKGLADAFLGELRLAARNGESFDVASGLPESMIASRGGPSWLELAQRYLDVKWPHAAAKSRDALTAALATVTAALVIDGTDEAPDTRLARTALRQFLLPPNSRTLDPPSDVAEAARWLVANFTSS